MKKSIIKANKLLLQTGNFEPSQLQLSSDRLCIIAPSHYMNENDIETILAVSKLCKLLLILTYDEEFKFSLICY